jgi:membrane protein DedA with SNARE-associated domain
MLNDNALQAFSTAAGISAGNLSLFLRTSLLAGFFIWAAWTALALMKFHKKHNTDNIANLLGNYVQLFFLVSVVIALVFIP